MHICTEVAIYRVLILTSDAKLGEPFLEGVDALRFCNLTWEGVPQTRAVGEESRVKLYKLS